MRGKPFLRKSLKTPLTLASLMSFPKKREIESSPEPKDKKSIPGQENEVLIVKSQPL
jgi:hypothetical protein